MTSSSDLQFDNLVVDTKLAQEYMKKNNFEFHNIGFKDSGETLRDRATNTIYFGVNRVRPSKTYDKTHCFKLIGLAEKIENNVDLFCQLEFLIRQIPIETTQRELNMIMKHLCYHGSLNTNNMVYSKEVAMTNNSSLIELGCVAVLAPIFVIHAEVNTAAVCHLFTELCRDAGIVEVRLLQVLKYDPYDSVLNRIRRNKVLEGGCIGVVTAQSDVEAAVHVFLSAPDGVVWGLRRILVQESAWERLKTELAWKTRSASQVEVDPELKSLCTDLYVYNGKMFLVEYVGSDTDIGNAVLIESFRTVKELLTLIEGYQPFCVSLWSHGAAESNEIAFSITAPMVWVNRYGTVGDHPQASLAYYCHTYFAYSKGLYNLHEVRKLQKKWIMLTLSERRRKVMAVLEELPESDEYTYYKQCIMSTQNDYGNFTHVGSNELVIGVPKPYDVYVAHCKSLSHEIEEILRFLVLGSGFLISSLVEESFKNCVIALQRAELPIRLSNTVVDYDRFPLVQYTKVIHTGIGTLFAN